MTLGQQKSKVTDFLRKVVGPDSNRFCSEQTDIKFTTQTSKLFVFDSIFVKSEAVPKMPQANRQLDMRLMNAMHAIVTLRVRFPCFNYCLQLCTLGRFNYCICNRGTRFYCCVLFIKYWFPESIFRSVLVPTYHLLFFFMVFSWCIVDFIDNLRARTCEYPKSVRYVSQQRRRNTFPSLKISISIVVYKNSEGQVLMR